MKPLAVLGLAFTIMLGVGVAIRIHEQYGLILAISAFFGPVALLVVLLAVILLQPAQDVEKRLNQKILSAVSLIQTHQHAQPTPQPIPPPGTHRHIEFDEIVGIQLVDLPDINRRILGIRSRLKSIEQDLKGFAASRNLLEQELHDKQLVLEESITALSGVVKQIQTTPSFNLATSLADPQAEMVAKFEETQNTQAHAINRELMLESEIFKSAVGIVFSMYRELGQDELPEDVMKQLEQRVNRNINDIFTIADKQRVVRNDQLTDAIDPPPPEPQPDRRDILALDRE